MAECLTPFTVKNKLTGESRAVACGRCPTCYARRVSQWSFRLMQHEKVSLSAHFITLTYDTKHVPISPNGFMDLSKRDLQLFFKRLRKLHPPNDAYPIRYFAVGEYGGKSTRPHYHLIMFNVDIKLIEHAWTIESRPIGQVHIGTVTGASIGYTLKYLSKKSRIPMHRNDDRVPEFSLMSKGLGANYLTPSMVHWHYKDLQNRMYCNLPDGKKISMPRYYKQILYSDEQRKAIGYAARQKQLLALEKNLEDPNYFRNKFEADKAAFRKMAANENQNGII